MVYWAIIIGFSAPVLLLSLDLHLFHRALRRNKAHLHNTTPSLENLRALEAALDWLENSREMRIRRRPFGNLYWDGWTLFNKRKTHE